MCEGYFEEYQLKSFQMFSPAANCKSSGTALTDVITGASPSGTHIFWQAIQLLSPSALNKESPFSMTSVLASRWFDNFPAGLDAHGKHICRKSICVEVCCFLWVSGEHPDRIRACCTSSNRYDVKLVQSIFARLCSYFRLQGFREEVVYFVYQPIRCEMRLLSPTNEAVAPQWQTWCGGNLVPGEI